MKITPESRIAVAGLYLIAATVCAQISGPTETIWLKNSMFAIAVLALLLAVWQFIPDVWPNIGKVLPMCKAKFYDAWSICARCSGFYIGFIFSAVLVLLVRENIPIQSKLESFNPWILLLMALVLVTPTAWQGVKRRLGQADPLPHPAARTITGFTSGLAWYFAYLSGLGFLNR